MLAHSKDGQGLQGSELGSTFYAVPYILIWCMDPGGLHGATRLRVDQHTIKHFNIQAPVWYKKRRDRGGYGTRANVTQTHSPCTDFAACPFLLEIPIFCTGAAVIYAAEQEVTSPSS